MYLCDATASTHFLMKGFSITMVIAFVDTELCTKYRDTQHNRILPPYKRDLQLQSIVAEQKASKNIIFKFSHIAMWWLTFEVTNICVYM